MATQRHSIAAIALALACSLAAAGCTPSAEPTPTATATAFRSDDEAFAAAEATYRAYVDALNKVSFADPRTFEAVYDWTGDPLRRADRTSFENSHKAELDIKGEFRIVSTSRRSIARDTGVVILDACLDISQTTVVDSAGLPQTNVNRVPVVALRLTLQPTGMTPTRLRLTDTQPREDGPSC